MLFIILNKGIQNSKHGLTITSGNFWLKNKDDPHLPARPQVNWGISFQKAAEEKVQNTKI